ncbi:solute carrier family 16 member 6b isoform X2 [Ictalurus furcatus]|nr:solute carrier family 16 member 6b isoform X2 [Ictalurus furcatus]XP_053472648.1 solute carrier family 16 member 6b isoform X2 [Ictalurus furcatus]XP_053472656.1 solute carrier family 16 member 6b isoform X2 [Ictalurus furcatus]XP_053472666.1 solute carrier family 16 member 6b isoform X2 [Ictalurus furcatus]
MMGRTPTLHGCMKPNVYPQAPDGGWGWVVAVAFFFVEVFTYGIIKVFGIFLQDLTSNFGETNSRVSWIVSICVFVMSFTAPLSSVLSNRFGFGPVVMVGGVLISLGTITTAFTTSITQMYITVGLITGLGYCLTFLPTVTILSQYFDKRRSLVTSFASTGECFSLSALAPAFSVLKNQVGWRNCMIVIGLLQASVIGCGALLRPIILQPECSKQEEELEGPQSPLKTSPENKYELENEFTHTSLNSVDSGVQSISSAEQNMASSETSETDLEEVERGEGEGDDWVLPFTPLKQKQNEERKRKFPDLSLLKDTSFICYSLFGLFATLGFFAPQLYVIELSVHYGVERNKATYMLSIMAAAEIFGRLSIGWLMNRKPIRKIYILLICTVLLSLVLALFPAVSSHFWALASCCAVCGFLFGTVASSHIPMLAEDDVLGMERMTMGAGVYVFIQSFAGLAGPPLAGKLVDVTKDYGSAFYSSAAGVCVGALFLSLVRPAKTGWNCCRRDRKCVKQEQEVRPDDYLEVDIILEQ